MASNLLHGDIVRIRDERWVVARHRPGASAAVLEVRGRDRTNRGARASFLLPFDLVEPLTSSRAPRLVRRRQWRRLACALLADATPSWAALRAPLRARLSLLAFQLEPALAVTRGLAARMLIADEVGLGKTIQAGLVIAEILARTRHGRVLVVAPASLKEQWHAELLERFAIDAWIADTASLARVGPAWTPAFNPWCAHPVTITSIDYVKRPEVMRSLDALVWDAVVFDEAHALARRSDRTTAARALARRARTVVMLTATPHSGDDRLFADLCRIGDLDEGFPLMVFRRTRTDVGLVLARRTVTLRVRPSLAEREMHRALAAYAQMVWARPATGAARLAMIVLTRRACSSAASLARSVERRLALLAGDDDSAAMPQMVLPMFDSTDDEEPGVELAAPGLADRSEERRRLEYVLRLARHAQSAESKLRALARLLRRTREPAIVFTEYRDTLATLAGVLRDHAPVTLHGGLTAVERRNSLRRFTTGPARVLIATDAASEGLNLQQRCRLVINLELPWTPLRLEQRIGRVERIGQARRIHAVHLLAADTAEESSVATLLMRADRAAEVLDGLRPHTTEDDIAATVMGQDTHGSHDSPLEHEPRVIVPDLRAASVAEADRLQHLRAVSGANPKTQIPNPNVPEYSRFGAWALGLDPVLGRVLRRTPRDWESHDRPTIAILRTRKDRRTLWAFRLAVTDADQYVIWETLLGVSDARRVGRGDDPRRWIEDGARALAPVLEAERRALVSAIEPSRRAALDLAAQRERAIAAALRADRARLSATLVQPSLFDRRMEQTFAAQSAVLDEALERCRARLEEIANTAVPVVEDVRLGFAVIRR